MVRNLGPPPPKKMAVQKHQNLGPISDNFATGSRANISGKKHDVVGRKTELQTAMSRVHACLTVSRTLRPQDTSVPRQFGTTKLVPKFKPNHRWSCVSSELLSWVEVSITALVSKCLEIGAEVSQSVLMPK